MTCVHLAKKDGVILNNGEIKLDVSKEEDWKAIIDHCPSGALTMDSRQMTVEEVLEEACKDAPLSFPELTVSELSHFLPFLTLTATQCFA